MVLQHNLPGFNAKRIYNKNSSKLAKSLEKLSSGYSINRAADDAAGLAVSEKMRSQIFGMEQSVKNCQDGISLIQTFEGALDETVTIIKRIKTLADQSANGTYDDATDRTAIETEYKQLCDEINHIADTDFNGLVMLNGRRMADKFTFLTEEGTKWITPSGAELEEGSFTSTFKKVEGFPEIGMTMEMLPDAKGILTGDKEIMTALEILNKASIKAFFNNGVPDFSLENISPEEAERFTFDITGYSAVIGINTAKSGKVELLKVSCTEFPHYASTDAVGLWGSSSVATGSYGKVYGTSPDGTKTFVPSEWTAAYVNSSSATKAKRQAYDAWIKATSGTATLIPDNDFNNDTDPLRFTWSIDGKEYQNAVGSNGVPTSSSGVTVPVYKSDYNGGPQVDFDGLRFYENDENLAEGARLSLSYTTDWDNTRAVGYSTVYGDSYIGGSHDFDEGRYYEIYLDHGATKVTLTYNRSTDKWSDNFGGSGSWNYYGLTDRFYNYSQELIDRDNYYKIRDARNLYHLFVGGKLPDKFQLEISINAPYSRTWGTSGYEWYENRDHTYYDGRNYKYTTFDMGEFDPENPDKGGVDYMLAKHGAVYTFDGTYREYADGVDPTVPTDPNDPTSLPQPTVVGTWRNEEGEKVDLEKEGIYLPANPHSTYVLNKGKIHDGMKIYVFNPTMVGEDYIQSDIHILEGDRTVNAFRGVYDNLTYSENLILQIGARTKDAVNFTFAYSTDSIGDLKADLDCTAQGLGLDGLTLSLQDDANFAIDKLDHALNKISLIRATFGAVQNRLEHKVDNLNNTKENLTYAESGIRDTNMAKEMMNFTKNQILTQSSQSMLAQANSLPQQVMSLLTA